MRFRSAIVLSLLLVTSRHAFAQQPAPAVKPHDFGKWEKEIAAYEEADKKDPPVKGGIVFTGSSTIRRWKALNDEFPAYNVLNRGFGGCEILDCTHFADRIVFPYEPKAVFLRCGGNDIHNGKTPEQVFDDFKDFLATVHEHLPNARVFYISQNPTNARLNQKDQEQQLNDYVHAMLPTTPWLTYIDVSKLPLDANGDVRPELFIADKLHFNDDGNHLLAESVRPYLPLAARGMPVAVKAPAVAQTSVQCCQACSNCGRRHFFRRRCR
jgi:lysophospholipase L1-like esterase